MDIVDYSSKLDTLYDLLLNKVNSRKKEKEEEQIKYDKIIKQNDELINRVKYSSTRDGGFHVIPNTD